MIEQGKGIVAQQGGLEMPGAFQVLRRYARDHDLGLTDLAQRLVSRRLTGRELLAHA